MQEHQIQEEALLDAALGAERFLLFKHSPRCPYSRRAFKEYEAFVDAHPEVSHGWLNVIDQRDWSARVARSVGVQHQSPQALLFTDGRVSWHSSHGGITRDTLEAAVEP